MVVDQVMELQPWEWDGHQKECIQAIQETMRKQGYDRVEVWADQRPDSVTVHYCYPPVNHPRALYRGKT